MAPRVGGSGNGRTTRSLSDQPLVGSLRPPHLSRRGCFDRVLRRLRACLRLILPNAIREHSVLVARPLAPNANGSDELGDADVTFAEGVLYPSGMVASPIVPHLIEL